MDDGKPEHGSLAARLRRNSDRIFTEWEATVGAGRDPALRLSGASLRNSLPDVIDILIASLESARPPSSVKQSVLAAGHGRSRALNADYSLAQVIVEYHALQRCVLAVADEGDVPLEPRERDLILGVFATAVCEAAHEFKAAHDQQKAAIETALASANNALKAELGDQVLSAHLKEQVLRTIFERVDDYAIFTLDADGHVATWSDGCRKMKEYRGDEIIGHHYSKLYPPEGRTRGEPEKHLDIAARHDRFRGEGLRMRKSGALFIADVFIVPIRQGEDIVGFLKVVADVTTRKALIQELDISRTQLTRLQLESGLRDRFIATLTHDLRNPLAAAQVSAEALLRVPYDAGRHADLAGRCLRHLKRVARMVTDLLDASRVREGMAFPLRIVPHDLCATIAEVRDEFASLASDRLVIQAPDRLEGHWDPHALRRMLDNLISNAIKYGAKNGRVTLRVMALGDRLLIHVHNFGSTIALGDQGALFEMFHRTDSARSGSSEGWGLGLTLVRGIAEAHGGVVKVRSIESDGTTFIVDLPRDARSNGE